MINRIEPYYTYFSLTVLKKNWPWRKRYKRLFPRLTIIPVKRSRIGGRNSKKYLLYYCTFRWMWLRIDFTWSKV